MENYFEWTNFTGIPGISACSNDGLVKPSCVAKNQREYIKLLSDRTAGSAEFWCLRKKNKVSYIIPTSFCLETISRLQSTWEPKLNLVAKLRKWRSEFRKAEVAGSYRESARQEEATQKESSRNVLSSRPCMCGWNPTKQGKKWQGIYRLILKVYIEGR